MSDRRAPLSIFVPTRKLFDHEMKFDPEFFTEVNATRKGSYAANVLVNWDCSPEGVLLTIDPWQWRLQLRLSVLTLVETDDPREVYETERRAAGELAAEQARREAFSAFPSYKRWALLKQLSETP